MLDLDDIYNNMYFDNFDDREKAINIRIINELDRRKERIKLKEAAIEELKYEKDLIFNDMLSIIRNDLANSASNVFRGFDSDLYRKAWKYFWYKDNLSDSEKETYKGIFDFMLSIITINFFGKELEKEVIFKEVIQSWTSGYTFSFEYKDQEIQIFIPTFSTVNAENYAEIMSGYRINYRERPACYGYVCGGLDYSEVGEKLQAWMLSEGWKKN